MISNESITMTSDCKPPLILSLFLATCRNLTLSRLSSLQEENSRLQDEVTRIRQQLDSSRASVSSSTNNSTIPSSSSRPTLPSLMGAGGGGGGSTPQPPSARPASTGPSAHGMFGGGAAAQIGEREREYAAQQGAYNGNNGRDQSVPVGGEHPNKRSRIDEDERRKSTSPIFLSCLFSTPDVYFL